MGYSLRDMTNARKFSSSLTVDALQQAIPAATITAVLDAANAHERRERKLTMTVTVWLIIAMHLYCSLALEAVLGKLAKGLRYIWPDPDFVLPSASAITYRRYQLGARPLGQLFHLVCQPIATPDTPGAVRFGLRLMAIDGTTEDLPDTEANARYFGRHHAARGDAAFPQVRAVYLVECGTHTSVDAGFWPLHTHERVGGRRLLRALTPDMVLRWDAGFHSYDQLAAVRARGAHLLGRLPATVKPHLVKTLPDGSELVRLLGRDKHCRPTSEQMLVRLVRYTVTDSRLVGFGETHRVVTTLLDPQLAPALELAALYHERWESELVIDELDTHQRLADRPLRSQTPVGVIQELYGLLFAH